MARIRSIKPGYYTDEDLATVSDTAYILGIALLNYSDDEGYFNANPALVKAACFPLRETSVSVPVALQELSDIGYIVLGKNANGKTVGKVTNFDRHQRVNKPTASTLKAGFEPNPVSVMEDSVTPTGILPEASTTEGKGIRKRNGNKEKEGECEGEPPAAPSPVSVVVSVPEVVDDVGLVAQHVRAVLNPRFTREAQEQFIKPRLKEGRTVAEMCLIVDFKKAEWGDDDRMRGNLKPETLFRKGHWESYLIAAQEWDERGRPAFGKNGKPNGSVADVAGQRLEKQLGKDWKEKIGMGA